jgi:Tol biopolymer transport system component
MKQIEATERIWRNRVPIMLVVAVTTLAVGLLALMWWKAQPAEAATDAGKIVFLSNRDQTSDNPSDIYIMNPDGSNVQRVTNRPGDEGGPILSPDGTKIAFPAVSGPRTIDIFVINRDGSGEVNLTSASERSEFDPAWSPDGKIGFDAGDPTSRTQDLYTMNADGTGVVNLTNSSGVLEMYPSWSPDGSTIAYLRLSGRIFTINADGSGVPTPVATSTASQNMPSWSPDGTQLFFTGSGGSYGEDDEIVRVDADGTDATLLTNNSNIRDFLGRWGSSSSTPVLNIPDNITEEATGPGGARVTFTVSVEDKEDGPSLPVDCASVSGLTSGDTFPMGTTTITCTVEDTAGNNATDSFDVTVGDTTPPAITGMPSDIVKEATGADGAQVFWSQPTATDLVDGSTTVNCTPPSGTTFALGETTVSCTATDTRSNTATKMFKVTVQDTTAPTVDAVNPVDGAKEVARGSSVTANFSEAVQAATLTSETVQLFSGNSPKPIKATLSRNPSTDPTSVTLTPSSKLDAKTRYTAKIKGGQSGVKDLAGNPLASDFSWSFTTGSK